MIEKHAEASITIKFDFNRLTPTSDAGTGQLPTGVTLTGNPVVRVMLQQGGSWTNVSEQFITDSPTKVDADTAVEQSIDAAGAGEQAITRIPYVVICICEGSDNETYVLLDDLKVIGTGRA